MVHLKGGELVDHGIMPNRIIEGIPVSGRDRKNGVGKEVESVDRLLKPSFGTSDHGVGICHRRNGDNRSGGRCSRGCNTWDRWGDSSGRLP